MPSGGINRRQNKRFNLSADIILEKETSSLNPIRGITRDLSMGGACCLIPMSVKVFTIVNMKIPSGSGEPPLEISGRVTWIREVDDEVNELGRSPQDVESHPRVYIIGIQFLTLFAKKKDRLKALLESHDD
jgi:hypothetical protein